MERVGEQPRAYAPILHTFSILSFLIPLSSKKSLTLMLDLKESIPLFIALTNSVFFVEVPGVVFLKIDRSIRGHHSESRHPCGHVLVWGWWSGMRKAEKTQVKTARRMKNVKYMTAMRIREINSRESSVIEEERGSSWAAMVAVKVKEQVAQKLI